MGSRRSRDDFESFSLLGWLTRPFRILFEWIGSFGGDDRIRDDEGGSWWMRLLTWPFRLLVALVIFMVSSWSVSRRGWPFVLGLPAFLGLLGMGVALWLHHYFTPRLIDRSQMYYSKFLIDEDWGPQVAQHFAAKRVVMEPDSVDAKYQLATVWVEVGKMEQAEDLMRFLASENTPRAHLWLARKILTANLAGLDEETDALVRDHIDKALQEEPDNPEGRALLANYYLFKAGFLPVSDPRQRDYVEKAAILLEFVFKTGSAEAYWQLPNLVRALMELDREEQARRSFDQARQALAGYLRRTPDDRLVPTIWSTLIRSAIQLKDYKMALRMVEDARRLSNSPVWTQELVRFETLIAIEEAKSFSLTEQFPQRMEVLCRMMAKFPGNRMIADQLVDALVSITDPPERNALLEQAKLATSHPEIIHLLQGIGKVADGDAETARTHWKIASHSSQENSQLALLSLLNVILVRHEQMFPEFNDMLALSMEMFPNQGLFYELRGAFHKQNERLSEAITDFLRAAEMISTPKNFTMHIHLIQCYEKTGDTEQADYHRRALQTIMNSVGPIDRQFMEELVKQSDQISG
jgi:tetratricopeptide (TPR) repeat protein